MIRDGAFAFIMIFGVYIGSIPGPTLIRRRYIGCDAGVYDYAQGSGVHPVVRMRANSVYCLLFNELIYRWLLSMMFCIVSTTIL